MTGFCPNCEKETTLLLVKGIEQLNIRGEMIPVETEYYRCQECGEEFEKPRPDYDPLAVAYVEYRRRKNMVQPEQIRAFRKKYGLTQKELSDLLGIGLATLSRYENGALQDEAHDNIFKLSMEAHNFLQLIEKNHTALNEGFREKLIRQISAEEKTTENWLDFMLERYAAYPPGVLSGYKRLDALKFFQVIKFYCFQTGIYKTKLLKLLFYADFKHFKDYSVSITGVRYAHLPYGPVPDQFEAWFAAFLDAEPTFSKEEVWCQDETPAEQFRSQQQPDISVFTPAELKTLAAVKEYFDGFSARKISDFSHLEKGYQETQNGELISYQFANQLNI
jgi:putative zinc finger/helix-turn-helix YgiT family protein